MRLAPAALVLAVALVARGSETLEVVVPAAGPLSSRVVFLVDASGSMTPGRVAEAIRACLLILETPTDSLEVRVLAFRGVVHVWPGLGGEGVPAGWTALPHGDALGAVSAWLGGLGGNGTTAAAPALRQALLTPRAKLSVVLITDGEFTLAPVLSTLKAGQAARVKAGHGRAHLLVWGVGAGARESAALKALGKAGGGGLWVYRRSGDAD